MSENDKITAQKRQYEVFDFFFDMLMQNYREETVRKIIAGSSQRYVSFRANMLKSNANEIASVLSANNIKFSNPAWSKDAFSVHDVRENKIRELEIYKEGKIYMQSLSSMLPPIALSPRIGADILDMTAAPGGKTTQISAMTGGKAHITACERSKVRAEKLKFNLNLQGAGNVLVLIQDARKLDDFFSFDQILLDAPCSGSGTLDFKNSKATESFTPELVSKSVALQRALMKKAVKLLKKGGELLYSTCSVLPCENDEIVETVLSAGNVEIVPILIENGEEIPRLPSKDGTLAVCPTEEYEGFYVAKLRKIK